MLGWHNVRCPDFGAQELLEFRSGAQRYEAGTHNLLGIVGLNAAMGLLLEIGVERIRDELLRMRKVLVAGLQKRGWEVMHATAESSAASGIVSFRREGGDMAQAHARLAEAGVVTTLRTDRQRRKFIRISPHFYNTDEELHRLLSLV